jgi:cytochrome c553
MSLRFRYADYQHVVRHRLACLQNLPQKPAELWGRQMMTKRVCQFVLVSSFLGLAPGAIAGDAAAGALKAPLCMGCHGVNGEGKAAANGQPAFPALAGQIEGYFIKSMNDYKNDVRVDPLMSAISKGLTDDDIANLAAYYAGLK